MAVGVGKVDGAVLDPVLDSQPGQVGNRVLKADATRELVAGVVGSRMRVAHQL